MAQQIRNQIVPQNQNGGNNRIIDPTGMKPTQFFTSAAVNNLLVRTFKSDQKAAAVVTTMLSIFGANRDFQNCNPMEFFANILRYEVMMGLSYANNDYAVISYGGKPQFQLQYQGVVTMAFATNAYSDGDCFEVREGEFKGYDARKRQPMFEWITDEDERLKHPIVGYYAWVELKDGRFKSKYMTRNEILRHADRYSKAFQGGGGLDAYRKMEASGNWPRGKSPWFGPADDLGHVKMCKKTVILQLFKDPMLPKSNGVMSDAISADEYQERTGESVTYADQFDAMAREAALAAQMEAPRIEAAPENIPAHPEQKPAETASRASEDYAAPAPVQPAAASVPQKRTRTAKKAEAPAPIQPAPPAPVPEQPDFPDMSAEPKFGPDDDDDPFGEPNW